MRHGPARSATATESVILGTAGYMSPEQVRGQPADHRSDIFSFGAMLLRDGERPARVQGRERDRDDERHPQARPAELSATDAAIPPPLASVIQHCLEKERDQRFQSARDLAFALSRLTGIVRVRTPRSPCRRGRRAGDGGSSESAAALALLIAVGTAAYLRRDPAVHLQPTFRQLTFRRGHIDTARFAPDGQTVISSASWDGKPFEISVDAARHGGVDGAPAAPGRAPAIDLAIRRARRDREGRHPRPRPDRRRRNPRVLDQVFDADWAPDGSLAVVRQREVDRAWVEYPAGKRVV